MQQTQTKQIQWTMDNISKCQCTECPVQSGSSCVSDKMQSMPRQSMASGGMQSMPSQQDTPKVYCSQGTASCGDLDFAQNCVCPTCQVWQENGLANYKYCRNGSAAEQG